MDCPGTGTGENNNITLSFFFLANLISKGSGKVHSSHFKWLASLCSVFWQGACRQHSVRFGREHFANIALLNHLLDFSSQLWYPLVLSYTCHYVCATKMHDFIVWVNNKLPSKWSSRKVSRLVSFNSTFTLKNICMLIFFQVPSWGL